MFVFLTNEGDSEIIFNTIQTRFGVIKQRDREFKSTGSAQVAPSAEGSHISSQTRPSIILPPRKYENNYVGSPVTAKQIPHAHISHTMMDQHPRPPIATKPSIRRHPTGDTDITHAAKSDRKSTSAKASEINSLIGENRGMFVDHPTDADNTYSVIGSQLQVVDSTAEYSAVYAQRPNANFITADDTYDEVNMLS